MAKMTRQGRELEKLVALLEESLCPKGAIVTSPGFLEDRTGAAREVDVCIRMPVGSVEVIVILECRDRHARQGVTWIEQLAQKRSDVLAAKAVAVSASGFSKNATLKARFHGIDLRTFEELDPGTVADWFRVEDFKLYVGRTSIQGAHFTLASQASGAEQLKFGFTEPCFQAKHDGCWYSLQGIWDLVQHRFDVHAGIPDDGKRVRRSFELAVRRAEQRFRIHREGAEVDVISFKFDVEVWLETRTVPLHRVSSYRTDEERLIATAEYVIAIDGQEEVLAISRDLRTKALSVSRRPLTGSVEELRQAWILLGADPGMKVPGRNRQGATLRETTKSCAVPSGDGLGSGTG